MLIPGCPMRSVLSIGVCFLAWFLAPALADAELILRDGSVLRGVEVRLAGDVYILESATGEAVSVPLELVAELRLGGGAGEDDSRGPALRESSGRRVAGADRDPRAPSGLREAEPRSLAGGEARFARPSEQLRVFRDPGTFPRSVIEHRWSPRSDWKLNLENNEFAPVEWAEGPVESGWTPRSAFQADLDVLGPRTTEWRPGIVDPFWNPEDAFERKSRFWED